MVTVLVWFLAGIAAFVLVVYGVVQYNRMVVLRNRITESWSNVDTELQRRHELVPNLVRAVQGYAQHERAALDEVMRLRAQATGYRGGVHGTSKLQGALAGALDRLLLVAEAYPTLKASQNFLSLQHELAVTEDRIQASRRFYNGNVRDYHNAILSFPGSVFAGVFGFGERPYFHVEHLHYRAAPQVRIGSVQPSAGRRRVQERS